MLHVKYLRIRSHKISSGYHQELIKFLHLFSWYSDTGNLDVIQKEMVNDLVHWREKYPNKPVMVTEYGADTISGE